MKPHEKRELLESMLENEFWYWEDTGRGYNPIPITSQFELLDFGTGEVEIQKGDPQTVLTVRFRDPYPEGTKEKVLRYLQEQGFAISLYGREKWRVGIGLYDHVKTERGYKFYPFYLFNVENSKVIRDAVEDEAIGVSIEGYDGGPLEGYIHRLNESRMDDIVFGQVGNSVDWETCIANIDPDWSPDRFVKV